MVCPEESSRAPAGASFLSRCTGAARRGAGDERKAPCKQLDAEDVIHAVVRAGDERKAPCKQRCKLTLL